MSPLAVPADAPELIKAVPFHSSLTADGHADNEDGDEPLMEGLLLDFSDVNDDNFNADLIRQNSLLTALRDVGIKQRPCMCMDLTAPRNLGLIVNGTPYADPDAGKEKPAAAKVVVPARHVVDISSLNPAAGESVIRCNPAYPAYRWFQAMNLILAYEAKTGGRVIPFPLQSERTDENGVRLGNIESTVYHALRVTKHEYMDYQRLLSETVKQDGVEVGFYHAAKFAYKVLFDRGATKIDDKVVGAHITNIIMMGKAKIKGVLLFHDQPDDWDEMDTRHHIYA